MFIFAREIKEDRKRGLIDVLSPSFSPGPSPAAAAWPATEAMTVGGGSGPSSPRSRR